MNIKFQQDTLFEAISQRDYAKINDLIGQGVDLTLKNPHGQETALEYATSLNIPEAVVLLLPFEASENSDLPMIEAATSGNVEILNLFLENGGDANTRDERGWTPLMEAADWGYIDIIRLLIAKGADATAMASDGSTALSVARNAGHMNVVNLLESESTAQ